MKASTPHLLAAVLLLVTSPLSTARAADDSGIEEIVVVANKTERPLARVAGQVTTVDTERLEWEQVQDLGDVARYEPILEADFTAPRFGATGIAIRGIGGNRVALELDGVPLPMQFDVGNFADSSRTALDPAIIDRIEILRGPASSLYGSDAMGGVIAIYSLDPEDLVEPGRSTHLGAGAGYFSATAGTLARVTGAWQGKRDGALLSVVHRRGHEPDNRSEGIEDDRLDLQQIQLFAKWVHHTDQAGTFRLSADLYDRQVDSDLRSLIGWERFANTESLTGDDEQRRGRVVVEHQLPQLPWLDEGSVMAYVQDNRTEQRTDELRSNRGVDVELERDFFFEEKGTGTEWRGRRDFRTGPVDHIAVGGVEWDRQHLEQRRDGIATTVATGATSTNILGEQFPLRDLPETTYDEVGVYLEDELSWNIVSVIPGLRWDGFWLDAQDDPIFAAPERLTDLQDDELSFRVGVNVRPLERLSLYFNWAEGFRAPPAEDVNLRIDIPQFNVVALPNPDLRPEESDNFEGGLRWRGDGLRLEAAGYHSRYDDFIESRARIGTEPDTGVLLFQSRNIEEATITGFEVDAEFALARLHRRLAEWSVDAGVHWADGENERTGEPLNTVAPLKLISGIRWLSSRWPLESGFRVSHYGEKSDVDETAGEIFVPDDATILDWTTRWSPGESFDLVFGLYNLTNERYWRYADVRNFTPGDPRIEVASQPGIHADLTLDIRF
jgi:hemoglobin/transferrin/lactoferrin receptor protein